MINLRLRGEFRCTLDVKGRFMLPVALQKQLPVDEREDYRNKLMINRGLDKCLVLYPVSEWDKIEDDLSKLNDFIEEERRFKRLLKSGLNEVDIDKSSRIVIPKMLMQHAGIKKNIVLYADQNKVEIWDEETYNKHIEENGDDLSILAEKVMGGKSE